MEPAIIVDGASLLERVLFDDGNRVCNPDVLEHIEHGVAVPHAVLFGLVSSSELTRAREKVSISEKKAGRSLSRPVFLITAYFIRTYS